jgi:methyl-accepting chemotaxis protein
MIFTIIPALLVILVILSSAVYIYVKDMMETEGKDEVKLMVSDFASHMETELLMYFEFQKQFNFIFSQYENMERNSRRKFYTDMAYKLLEKNEKVLSAWVDFDKNALDGQDDNYKSVGIFPRSGRFSWVLHRYHGVIRPEVEAPDKPIENFLDDPYYSLPKKAGSAVILEPFYYDYETKSVNSGTSGTLITSIGTPIFNSKNQIVGVSGIDILLENYVALIERMKPYETGYVTLYSSGSNLLSHPNKELIGKNITYNKDFPQEIADDIYKNILKKQPFKKDVVNKYGEKILLMSAPVFVGIEGEELMLCVYVPYSEFTDKIVEYFV